jgi:hypothetical protein
MGAGAGVRHPATLRRADGVCYIEENLPRPALR